ncbi:hypothetical protein [Sphaerisporangium rhizosphaerae]|uniref:SGNH hydrolase-type esterase domain-containing protein n=1 Tax=Sphaerisporangium rhizosphaerae TaxID=2269375 RepID=A0ABW2PIY2_9ACTN
MEPEQASAEAAARLAQLLADTRGAEIMAEWQKLGVRAAEPASEATGPSSADRDLEIGIWRAERTGDGVELRRRDDATDAMMWADAGDVSTPGGARRVVLVGESAARGWLLDPVYNPVGVLRRHLDAAAPGGYQCVDLAKSGADLATLEGIVRRLPVIEPDVVILFAGNNFAFPPLDDSYRDLLAEALRTGGYPQMLRRFVDAVVLPRTERFLEHVGALQRDRGIEVVVVVPQANVRGWAAAPHIDVPALPGATLAKWYKLRGEAMSARAEARWEHVRALAAEMSELDGGTSPVSWRLQGRAAEALGDGRAARELLQMSRDAVSGLLVDHVTSILTEVRQAQIAFAQRHGMRYIDLGEVLASPDLPDLPDPEFFFDNCHMTDEGIERAMCRVADAVLGIPVGTTKPGEGAAASVRAVAHSLAAAVCAFRNQSAQVVRVQLRRALDADAEVSSRFITSFLDALESPGPKWISRSLGHLLETPQAMLLCLQLARTRHHAVGFWTFRECAQEMLHRFPARHQCGWTRKDLLATADGRGLRTPSFAPGKAYLEATTQRTRLAFALGEARSGVLRLTYRLPGGGSAGGERTPPAMLTVNDIRLGALSPVSEWTTTAVEVPAAATRPGVNWVEIEWPVPDEGDAGRSAADAAALARRMFPRVLPTFGELFWASLDCGEGRQTPAPHTESPMASRNDTSRHWRPAP